ncbi:F-box/LRR-repeat protein [Trifolium repens]|nr:F-box/LRR-repeat protein [Trifolium repens]
MAATKFYLPYDCWESVFKFLETAATTTTTTVVATSSLSPSSPNSFSLLPTLFNPHSMSIIQHVLFFIVSSKGSPISPPSTSPTSAVTLMHFSLKSLVSD